MNAKLYSLFLLICLIICLGCSNDYDDSKLWDSVNGLENRVAKLEELCKQINTNISSLQEIVKALQKNESIKSVATLPDGSGYLITFSSGKSITIYHGKNGTNGEDGKDGHNGTNGITPVISVKKDTDGIYYWTINNEWLLVDGKKVKAEGTDGEPGKGGEDGTNGKDGTTPQFKITDGYWYISYDNESSWTKLGKATGDSGLNGTDGDNFFKGVSIEDGYVCFTLNDMDSTVIKLPFVSKSELTVEVKEPGTLKSLLTDEDMRTIISLKLKGSLNEDDFATIRCWMFVVENVDLSETNISEVPGDAFKEMPRLKKVILPQSCIKIGDRAFYKCRILMDINTFVIQYIGDSSFYGCENLSISEFPMTHEICENAFVACRKIQMINAPNAVISASAIDYCLNLKSLNIGNFKDGVFDGNKCAPDLIITLKGDESGTILCKSIKNVYSICIGNKVYNCINQYGGNGFENFQATNLLFEEPSLFPDFKEGIFQNAQIQNITIPTSIAKIGKLAFTYTSILETVTIPLGSRLREIEMYYESSSFGNGKAKGIFCGCSSLKAIYCHLLTPPKFIGSYYQGLFGEFTVNGMPGHYNKIALYVPAESIEKYEGWSGLTPQAIEE